MLFNEKLMRDIELCQPQPGQCAFWWLGQMSLIVKTATRTLCFDLFLTDIPERLFPVPVRPELLHGIDAVFGSHDHLDHIDDPVWRAIAASSEETMFALPGGLSETVSRRLDIPAARLAGLEEGKDTLVNGIHVRMLKGAHEVLNDRNENAIFIAEVDGITICHMGDTCLYDGLIAKLKAVGPIDILMLPINGRDARRLHSGCIGNMTWQEAVDLVGEVKPGLAIPGHYDMIAGNTENPMCFASYLEIKYPDQDFWIGPHARQVLWSR